MSDDTHHKPVHHHTDGSTALEEADNGPMPVLIAEFDWDAIDRGNPLSGFDESYEPFKIAGEAMFKLNLKFAEARSNETAGIIAKTVAWFVHPALFSGCSMQELADQCGVTKQRICAIVSELRDEIFPSYHRPGLKSESSREVYRLRATESHRKRKEREAAKTLAPNHDETTNKCRVVNQEGEHG